MITLHVIGMSKGIFFVQFPDKPVVLPCSYLRTSMLARISCARWCDPMPNHFNGRSVLCVDVYSCCQCVELSLMNCLSLLFCKVKILAW